MLTRRLAASAVAVVFSFGLALAQKAADPASLDRIENWTAPPYWLPLGEVAIAKAGKEVGLEPQAVEGVPTPALAFTGITPCRIVDTRGNGFIGSYGPPLLFAGVPRSFTLTGQCGIPGGAEAVSLNVTVTNSQGPGHIVIYPQGGVQPTVSTLNYVGGQTIANAAVVPLSAGGGITVIAGVSGTELILDTNGYYAPQTVVNTVNGLSGAVMLAQGTNITITPSGQTLTIANTAPAAWRLTGNSGTTAGTNFLGTTDNQALELKVNGERALRLEPLSFPETWGPNLIGGFSGNFVAGGLVGGTIGGGGQIGLVNRVTADFGTVGGGWNNVASGHAAVVDGGRGNTASGNQASLGGGRDNTASGLFATIPGGFNNAAAGNYSFAGGRRAKANDPGAFVWGDSTDEDVSSSGANSFVVRATGGFEFLVGNGVLCELQDANGWVCGSPSDRALKRDVSPVDARETLERLVAMPIHTWSYIAHQPAARHMGPMAQDFAEAYGLGSDDKRINPLDANGVALAAIQGLYAEVQELRKRLAALEEEKD